MQTVAERKDSKLKHDNVWRMCHKFGLLLGKTGEDEWWVCDGQVWCIMRSRALLWCNYFDFLGLVRRDKIEGFEPVEGSYLQEIQGKEKEHV